MSALQVLKLDQFMRGEWNRLMAKLGLDIGESFLISDPGLTLPQSYDIDPRLADIVFHQGFATREFGHGINGQHQIWTFERPQQIETVPTQIMMEICVDSVKSLIFLPRQELVDLYHCLKSHASFNNDHWIWTVQDPYGLVEPDSLQHLDELMRYGVLAQILEEDQLRQIIYYVDAQVGESPQPNVSVSAKQTRKSLKTRIRGEGVIEVSTATKSSQTASTPSPTLAGPPLREDLTSRQRQAFKALEEHVNQTKENLIRYAGQIIAAKINVSRANASVLVVALVKKGYVKKINRDLSSLITENTVQLPELAATPDRRPLPVADLIVPAALDANIFHPDGRPLSTEEIQKTVDRLKGLAALGEVFIKYPETYTDFVAKK